MKTTNINFNYNQNQMLNTKYTSISVPTVIKTNFDSKSHLQKIAIFKQAAALQPNLPTTTQPSIVGSVLPKEISSSRKSKSPHCVAKRLPGNWRGDGHGIDMLLGEGPPLTVWFD